MVRALGRRTDSAEEVTVVRCTSKSNEKVGQVPIDQQHVFSAASCIREEDGRSRRILEFYSFLFIMLSLDRKIFRWRIQHLLTKVVSKAPKPWQRKVVFRGKCTEHFFYLRQTKRKYIFFSDNKN